MEETTGIIAAVGAVVTFLGVMVARWAATPSDAKWWVRLARVFDVTQIVDTTRSLGDD